MNATIQHYKKNIIICWRRKKDSIVGCGDLNFAHCLGSAQRTLGSSVLLLNVLQGWRRKNSFPRYGTQILCVIWGVTDEHQGLPCDCVVCHRAHREKLDCGRLLCEWACESGQTCAAGQLTKGSYVSGAYYMNGHIVKVSIYSLKQIWYKLFQ